jgi:hypothetical protein
VYTPFAEKENKDAYSNNRAVSLIMMEAKQSWIYPLI